MENIMHDNVCLAIHGHFYQPPRENAWTDKIEKQPSAAPYHDWNERIYQECYLPNTQAKVFDEDGKLINTVNNFEKISFNVGPTLFSWLEQKHLETYQKIIGSDRKSVGQHGSHGNAMAQVYNHMIMPLANRRDQITQVKWGIYDFKHRFGREPEGMWLPETACNEETIGILIDEGIKFTILSPHQAEAVRAYDHSEWHHVSSGSINPRVPYQVITGPQKSLAVFFYDGTISSDVAFGSLAYEAKLFADRLEQATSKGDVRHPELIHIATDGETFGHHKGFGERALAYLMDVEAPKRGFKIVNYGEFLDLYPARHEVKLKKGEDGKGTAWSCAHGLKRWSDHCGCRGDGPVEWAQHWRRPLRNALDWLRNQLIPLYEQLGGNYFKDVWEARNDYIRIISDRSKKSQSDFFKQHSLKPLTEKETVSAVKLIEMQKFAMLMYTSCGWFFTEISGIETVQIIQYAARVIQLAEELTKQSFEEEFLNRLSEAKSNISDYKDGRRIYERLVKPVSIG